MRILGLIVGVAALCVLPSLGAAAGLEAGLRGGTAHANGDLFGGSGDPGSGGLWGIVVSLLPVGPLEVELAYERYTSEFDFDAASFGDTFFGGEADYTDQAYLVTGKLRFPILAGGVSAQGGAGVSVHHLSVDVTASEDVGDLADQLEDERDEMEWHLVAGIGARIPLLPVRIYGEVRYQDLAGENSPDFTSVYAGANLVFR